MVRKVQGFALAPLVPALICAGWAWARASSETAGIVVLGVLIVGYLAELVVGWPLLAWAARRGRVGLVSVLAVGAGSAIVAMVVLSALMPDGRAVTRLQGLVNLLSIAIPLGLVAAFTLWVIAFRSDQSDQ